MTRARAALLSTTAMSLLVVGSWGLPIAHAAPPFHGTVIVFVVDRVSFEEVMAISQFRAVGETGGAALVATSGSYREDETSVYQALGSGADPAAGHVQLMGRSLDRHGVAVCVREGAGPGRLRPPSSKSPTRFLGLGPNGDSCPGGTGANPDEVIIVNSRLSEAVARPGAARSQELARLRRDALETEGKFVEGIVGREPFPGRLLLLVITPSPSAEMHARGDEVTPLLMARGSELQIFEGADAPNALRSDTSRQAGLVANVDVAPTILEFFGIPIPAEMDGQPIEFTEDSAPFKLHRLHLEQRRIRLPIQLAEVAFVSASGAVAIVVLLMASRRGSLSSGVGGAMRFLALCVVALPIPLMLGGLLPRLTYWVVLPFVVVSVVGLAILASSARWPVPVGPITFLGIVGLAVVIVDALFGWRGARIPLLGGTMFDGARFYGLPNAFLSLLLAGSLFAAAVLPAFPGFLVLAGAGLFAGFPSLGADVGGAITLFFAAGMWWVLRTRQQFRLKELAFVAGVTAMGLGVVLLANRYLPGTPTHVTTFAEGTDGGLGGVVREFGDRLSVGLEQVRNAPAALIPLLGLPIILALVRTRPGAVGWGLEAAGTRWQHALIVLTLAGMVAFFVNDTGLAAAAPVFLYAMSGVAYPALLASTARVGPKGESHE